MPVQPIPTLHHRYSLFNVDSELLDRVAFHARTGGMTKAWIQLHDGRQQMFHRLRADRIFQMLESDDPDACYRDLVAWQVPDEELVDLPKRGMPCGPGMRERTYRGHFKDRQPSSPPSVTCRLDF